MKHLTQKDLNLAAELLRLASDIFANRNCNDIDDSVLANWTTEEKKKLGEEYHKWNGDLEHLEPEEIEIKEDWVLMDAIANRLDGTAFD